jgi:UrcA family protein
MHTPRIALAAAALLVAVGPARAQTGPILVQGDVPTATVSYADLNIASAAGRHTLEGRVSRAASRLCLDSRRAPVGELLDERRCFSAAMDQAERDIDVAVGRAHAQLALAEAIRIVAK